MPSTPRVRRAVVAAAAAVVLPFALGACGEDAGEKAAEELLEGAAGGDTEVDVDDDGNVKVEGSEGSFEYGEGLPSDFPEDDIPIVGEVTYGAANDTDAGKGWQVAAKEDGSAEDVYDEAREKLEDAGFSVNEGQEYGQLATLSNDEYDVVLTVGDNGDGTAGLSYAVTAKS